MTAPPDRERRPGRLSAAGRDPDPRFTFANERTFLAWNRTSLALIAAGLAVAELVDFRSDVLRLALALPLIALGGVLAVGGYRRWVSSELAMRLDRPLPESRLPALVAGGVAAGAVATVAVVLVDALG